MKIFYPSGVRSVAFSSSNSHPLQVAVGLDNGTVCRWDLKNGQKGVLDRIPLAHIGAVTSLDWRSVPQVDSDDSTEWILSSGLDRMVKVWNLPSKSVNKPAYILQPAFPVRRAKWRPDRECEIAVVSNAALGTGSDQDLSMLVPEERKKSPPTNKPPPVGHAVEIWDVRRGAIAMWQVRMGSGEGGVNGEYIPPNL